jgi:hypothetical protein
MKPNAQGEFEFNMEDLGVTLGILTAVGGASHASKALTDRWRKRGMSKKGAELRGSLMTESQKEATLLEEALTYRVEDGVPVPVAPDDAAEEAQLKDPNLYKIIDGTLQKLTPAETRQLVPGGQRKLPELTDGPATKYFFQADDSPLSHEERVREREYLNYVNENYDQMTEDYKAQVRKEWSGYDRVASGDEGKFVIPGVEEAGPKEFTVAHEAASAYAKSYLDTLLAREDTAGMPVMILGGASGAGKTSTTSALGKDYLETFAAIIDTTSTSIDSIKKKAAKIRETGRPDTPQGKFQKHLQKKSKMVPSLLK